MNKKYYKMVLKNIFDYFFYNFINLFLLILLSLSNIIILYAQWEPCNNGLGGGEVWSFIIDGNNTYTGIDGGVFMITDNGDNWIAKNKGLKGLQGINILSLAISGNNIFTGTFFDGVFFSADKGENWVQKSNGLPYWVNNVYDTIFLETIRAITISGNYIFVGTNKGIFVSSNNGDNWFPKNNGLPKFDSLKEDVLSFAVSGNDIYASTRYGVYITTDNGNNWTPKNQGMGNLTVFSLAINVNNIYAGTEIGLFLSTNNGDDWKNIGFQDTAIVAILINGNYIFASGNGFSWSTDNGNSWTAKNSGLTYLGIRPMIINGDYIFAGTNEAGIFRAKLSDLGITDVKETEQKKDVNIYPNPASSEVKLKFESTNISKIQISIFDLLGKEVFSSLEDCNIGTNEKVIDCRSLGTGYYIIRLKQNAQVEAKPLLILK
jgi:photosystem II stability/assembly factor-like uncharacterized protein